MQRKFAEYPNALVITKTQDKLLIFRTIHLQMMPLSYKYFSSWHAVCNLVYLQESELLSNSSKTQTESNFKSIAKKLPTLAIRFHIHLRQKENLAFLFFSNYQPPASRLVTSRTSTHKNNHIRFSLSLTTIVARIHGFTTWKTKMLLHYGHWSPK